MPRAVVAGGSIGGLSAALALRDSGFEVTVHERASATLGTRGAGIVAHEVSLRRLTGEGGLRLDDLSIPSRSLRYFDSAGRLVHEQPSAYRFTSWHTLHSALLALFGADCYRWGSALRGFTQGSRDGIVTVTLADASTLRADLLVCADGITSTARGILAPRCRPRYAGYVGWRGIVPAEHAGTRLLQTLGHDITYQLLDPGHILAYPIPAAARPGGAARPGYLNWVWYRNVAEGPALDRLRTDAGGTMRELSVPPGAVRSEEVAELRSAASGLEENLRALVLATREPFIQVIVDVEVPRMVSGQVCLLGDAAFVARPHAAAGTAKAAADAQRLGEVMSDHRRGPGDRGGRDHGDAGAGTGAGIAAALAGYERTQLPLGRALVRRARALGDGVQFEGSWRPGDPRLLFGLSAPGDSAFPAT